jgi:hypothetical protein
MRLRIKIPERRYCQSRSRAAVCHRLEISVEVSQMPSKPTREQIEKRAYELFLTRGCEHGRDVEDWLAAEQELEVSELEEPRVRSTAAAAGKSSHA